MNDTYLSSQLTSISSNLRGCTSNNIAINNTGCIDDNAIINGTVVNGTLLCRCDTTYSTQGSSVNIQIKPSDELKPLKFLPL